MTERDRVSRSDICFVALGAYSVLVEKNPKNIIGPDVAQAYLALQLKNYFDISIISCVDEKEKDVWFDGIKFIKFHRITKTNRLFYLAFSIIEVYKTLKRSNSSIVYHTGAAAGLFTFFGRLMKKRIIFVVSSDALVDTSIISRNTIEFGQSKFRLNYIGNYFDIKFSNIVVVQNKFQKSRLLKNFGKDPILIEQALPLADANNYKEPSPLVLWVGSMADVKQPDLFLDLARMLPGINFLMIGGESPGAESIYSNVKMASEFIQNLEFVGAVPFFEIEKYYRRATILVNTSLFEGFPYSFLQAWMNYAPVVSLNADPDGIIEKYNMGYHSKNFDKLINNVREIAFNRELREKMGENGRRYVEENHDPLIFLKKYLDIINEILL